MKKFDELIKRFSFTIIILFFFYLGQGIPVPGYHIDFRLSGTSFSLERMISLTTGGLFSSPTLLTLGMSPYMTVSIILSIIMFSNRELSLQISQEKKGRIEIIGILILSILQSIPLAFNLRSTVISKMNYFSPLFIFWFTIICFITGALIISWLASLNVVYGIGGPFILILPGVMRGISGGLFANYNGILSHLDRAILFILVSFIFLIITSIIYFSEYRIAIQRIAIDNYFNESYVAFRLLISGSMPLMFGTTLMYLPAYIMQLMNLRNDDVLLFFDLTKMEGVFSYGLILYVLGILFSFINIMPDQVSKNLQESGDYIIGIPPGKKTTRYITNKVWGISVVGSSFLPIIVTTPLLIGIMTHNTSFSSLSNYFAMMFVLIVIYDSLQQDVKFLYYKNNYELFGKNWRSI